MNSRAREPRRLRRAAPVRDATFVWIRQPSLIQERASLRTKDQASARARGMLDQSKLRGQSGLQLNCGLGRILVRHLRHRLSSLVMVVVRWMLDQRVQTGRLASGHPKLGWSSRATWMDHGIRRVEVDWIFGSDFKCKRAGHPSE